MRGVNKIHYQRLDPPVIAERGFTFLELLVVIAIAGILVGLAVPSFNTFMERERLSALSNEFVSAVYVVRSAAIKSGVPVVLCASDDGSSCGSQWNDGWLAFVDDDRDASPGATELVVLRQSGDANASQISVDSVSGDSLNAVRFNYRGAPDVALSVTVTSGSLSHSITVTHFGKPRHND